MRNKQHSRCGTTEDAALRAELRETHAALIAAFARFNAVSEPELIDDAIYEINAVQARYNYLHRMIREHSNAAACHAVSEAEGSI